MLAIILLVIASDATPASLPASASAGQPTSSAAADSPVVVLATGATAGAPRPTVDVQPLPVGSALGRVELPAAGGQTDTGNGGPALEPVGTESETTSTGTPAAGYGVPAEEDPADDAEALGPAEATDAAAGPLTPAGTALLDQPDPAVALGAARAAATTGVPDGTPLTPATGEIWIRTPGQVIDGMDLTGCLVIAASNVTIRNTRVSCRNPSQPAAIQVVAGNWDLVIEDSEIDGLGGADIGIGWNNYTLRRVEIRNVADGAKAGSNVTIEDSWIHDMLRKGTLHPDAIQSTGGRNIVIRGNFLNPVPTPLPVGSTDVRNSAIQLGSENGNGLSDVLIESNILVGGNYTVNVRGDTVVQNVVFRGNTFNGPRRYGPIQAPPSVVFEDNIDLVTGGTTTQVRLVYS